MATSGTTTFESGFLIDDVIQESYDRVGISSVSGYQLKSARRSLNIMFQEWANRGLHYWEIDKTNIDLVEGQAEYKFFRSFTGQFHYYVVRFNQLKGLRLTKFFLR